MRKTIHFQLVLALFLLVPASITWAQNITQEKGLTTATFTLNEGTVRIFLPDDIRQGDIITGTITAKPEGRNEKQIQRNLAELSRYAFGLNGQRFNIDPAGGSFRFVSTPINQAQQNIGLYFDKSTNPTQQLSIPPKPVNEQKPRPMQCVIPGHVLQGAPMNVPGPFDGNADNTQCAIGNQPATVLAESPRNCIVSFPPNATGNQQAIIQEQGGSPCIKDVSSVILDVSAGKLNLVKGENTFIDVKISGLQGLERNATLTIINLTPETVLLQPSNTIVIPLEPAAMASGNFNQRFPVQSLKSGGFTCNVNLDFGDVMLSPDFDNQSPDFGKENPDGSVIDEHGYRIEPGMVFVRGKDCNCAVKAGVHLTKVEDDVVTYMAMPQAGCRGLKCLYKNDLSITWQIVSGDANATIIEKGESGFTIRVRRKNGNYTIKCTVKVTCSDGTTCTDDVIFDAGGKEVGGDIKPPDPKIAVLRDEPKMPVDSIPDKTIKGCFRSTGEDYLPRMDGGLKMDKDGIPIESVVVPKSQVIQRDDYIPLIAEGADFDMFIITCAVTDLCKEGNTVKIVPLSGRVKFEWQIIEGPTFGKFVKMGCLFTKEEDGQKTVGERVIFQPPYVKLPVLSKDTSITTRIKLSIIDDKESLKDAQVDREFQVITHRNVDKPDEYTVEIVYTDKHKLPEPVSKNPGGKCMAVCSSWEPGAGLVAPEVVLPNVPDNKKMVLGEWILLEATDQRESDVLPGIKCESDCSKILPFSKVFEDKIEWSWSAKGGFGKFIGGSKGRYVIYQAQTFMAEGHKEMVIEFTVTASNEGGVQKDDGSKTSKPVTITVYEPGIQMQFPDKSFVPMANNSVFMQSELMYRNGDKWLPGLAHMGRIHFFELIGPSKEKGICMNDPLPDLADECLDLQIKKENENSLYEAYEAYLPGKTKCTLTDQWLKARNNKPERVATIEVSSLDYGSYGFMRSTLLGKNQFGKLGLYYYQIINWTDANVPKLHKDSRRKKQPDYADNRVTIPLDIDENHIPDNGYPILSGELVPDPVGGKADLDNIPIGDNFKGDGLTNYEEYRGFMYQKSGKQQDGESVTQIGEDLYVRTNHLVKTIFIHNKNHLPIELYKTASGLEVFEISEIQYQSNDNRVVNFNSNPLTNIVKQKGLFLYDGKSDPEHLTRMGMAKTTTNTPARPNDVEEIIVYTEAIQRNIHKADSTSDAWNEDPEMKRKFKDKKFEHLDRIAKLAKTVAHELLHGNAVWHHGEGDDALEKSHDAMRGLRSGDISCVMRYDNTGTKNKSPLHFPEQPGTMLCNSLEGTGFNAPVMIIDGNKNFQVSERGYGNCSPGRGNCAKQIRISGVDPPPSKR